MGVSECSTAPMQTRYNSSECGSHIMDIVGSLGLRRVTYQGCCKMGNMTFGRADWKMFVTEAAVRGIRFHSIEYD